MLRGREQRGRGSHVRTDQVRPPQLRLDDEPSQESTHRARGQQVVPAFGRAEAGKVDGEEAGVLGQRRPHRRERVQALRPGTREHDNRSGAATAVGVPDVDSADGTELDRWDCRL
jgi:hypothetical protein